MAVDGSTIRELADVLADNARSAAPKQPTLATATVTQSDDELWVMLDGADAPTPVESTTVAVRPGDVVTVRIGEGRAIITGNMTAPATDDMVANMAGAAAANARALAAGAMDAAESAVEIARNANKYTALTDEGVVVGELENGQPVGGYTVVKDNGFEIDNDEGNRLWSVLKSTSNGQDIVTANLATSSGGYAKDTSFISENGPSVSRSLKGATSGEASLRMMSQSSTSQTQIYAFGPTSDAGHAVLTIEHSFGTPRISANAKYIDFYCDRVRFEQKSPFITRKVNLNTVTLSTNYNLHPSIPQVDGYTPVSINEYYLPASNLVPYRLYITEDDPTQGNISIRNVTGTSTSTEGGWVRVLYVRNEML